jgi:uncharacterized protein (TIGR02186 family)
MRLALVLFAALVALPAGAETLVASLSTSRVAITSNYTGSSIVVFGAIERDSQTISRSGAYDIVVTVRGPRESLVIREKEPVGPIWINREQQRFINVPLFLAVLSSRPVDEITTEVLQRRLRIGIEAIIYSTDYTIEREGEDVPFREALIRLRRQEGLYRQNPRGVTFLTPSLFRAAVPLPATAPPGNYEVEAALFADSVMLARAHTSFELVKSGFEQQVAAASREWSWAYGLAVAGIALAFGWTASMIFRRD